MTFSDNYLVLMAKMRDSINREVERSTVKSKFLIFTNCLSITDLDIQMKGFTIVEVHRDCLVASNGIPYHFEDIPFEDLCKLVDSL